jgi:hypothetical protein
MKRFALKLPPSAPSQLVLAFFFFVGFFLIVVSRRPDAILVPQFWAEDGYLFYAQAHHLGWKSLLIYEVGYLQSLAKLTALLSLLLPLSDAPLFLNAMAISIQILPALFFLSRRFEGCVPDLKSRLLFSCLYLALPYTFEVHANITNAQWRWAVLAFLVIIAKPAPHAGWKAFDVVVLSVCGLSGPFCVLLLPVLLARIFLQGQRENLSLLIVLGFFCLIQGSGMIFFAPKTRSPAPLGASVELLLQIVSSQVFLGSCLGEKGLLWIQEQNFPFGLFFLAFLYGLSVIALALAEGPSELRLLWLFAFLILAGALAKPMASLEMPQWQALALPGTGCRYWFLPGLAFAISLCRVASLKNRKRFLAAPGLALLLLGMVWNWRLPAFQDMDFEFQAVLFNIAPAGEKVRIPLNPPGWSMELVKK